MTSALAVLFAALGWYACTGAGTAWAAAWIAPVPLLVVALRSERPRLTAAMVFAAYALGGVDLLRLYGEVVPVPVVLAVIAGSAAAYTAVVALVRWARGRLPDDALVLLFPAAWTTFELAQSAVSPNGTAGSLAYTQSQALPLAQITAITGWPGLTFLVTWGPAAVAWAVVRRDPLRLIPPIIAVGAVVAFGLWRLEGASTGAPLRVGLAAEDDAAAFVDAAAAPKTLADYRERVADLVGRGAEVVLLPEEILTITQPTEVDLPLRADAQLIVGVNDVTTGARRNAAWWFDKDGRLVATYHKRHLVPGLEADVEPGDGLVVRDGWGLAICKDLDFPALARRYAREGARLLFVPAWDFGADGALHAKMAMLRGVESGFSVVRAAREGRLTVSDDRGRILVDVASADPGQALATVRPSDGPTMYARIGDVFGGAVAASCAILVLVAAWRGRSEVQRE